MSGSDSPAVTVEQVSSTRTLVRSSSGRIVYVAEGEEAADVAESMAGRPPAVRPASLGDAREAA